MKNRSDSEATVQAVFFDAGNTLLRATPSVADIYRDTARRYGTEASRYDIEQSFKREWQRARESGAFMREAAGDGQLMEKAWWKEFVRRVFAGFPPISDFDGFFDELYDIFARPRTWELFPDVPAVLDALEGRVRLGVISNWDSRLEGILEGLGIKDYFSEIVISSLVEIEKPDRKIFRLASDRIGVPLEHCAHIGDDPTLDYHGALDSGMTAFLIDRDGRENRSNNSLRSLDELLPRIGLD